MRAVNLPEPERFPRIAIMIISGRTVLCSLCSGWISINDAVHAHPDCGATYVAIASILGLEDPRLNIRPDLPAIDITPRIESDRGIWLNIREAEIVAHDIGMDSSTGDYVIQRLIAYAAAQQQSGNPAPYPVRECPSGDMEVDFGSALQYLESNGPFGQIGTKSTAFIRGAIEYVEIHGKPTPPPITAD